MIIISYSELQSKLLPSVETRKYNKYRTTYDAIFLNFTMYKIENILGLLTNFFNNLYFV